MEVGGSLLQTGDMGSPLYWAPEIWRCKEDYDFSVDVYAYGIDVVINADTSKALVAEYEGVV
jgi:serine/threonine protein kinase